MQTDEVGSGGFVVVEMGRVWGTRGQLNVKEQDFTGFNFTFNSTHSLANN
jgi:hypothetical protein